MRPMSQPLFFCVVSVKGFWTMLGQQIAWEKGVTSGIIVFGGVGV